MKNRCLIKCALGTLVKMEGKTKTKKKKGWIRARLRSSKAEPSNKSGRWPKALHNGWLGQASAGMGRGIFRSWIEKWNRRKELFSHLVLKMTQCSLITSHNPKQISPSSSLSPPHRHSYSFIILIDHFLIHQIPYCK